MWKYSEFRPKSEYFFQTKLDLSNKMTFKLYLLNFHQFYYIKGKKNKTITVSIKYFITS